MTESATSVTFLGLGAMGTALAGAALDGRRVTVWNRTPNRMQGLVDRGAVGSATVRDAVSEGGPVVVCLYDHASVKETLQPVADALHGRTVINLTTTTPEEARELASWAADQNIAYLDGAIMAVPQMIGTPDAQVFYSGSREVFDAHHDLLDQWAASSFEATDPGLASLLDLAMLSGMYSMFAGFLHGVAMIQPAGITAAGFAERTAPFLAAMTTSFASTATVLDSRDYSDPPQSLDWTLAALKTISRASREQDVLPAAIDLISTLAEQQINAGHGADDFNRIIEAMRTSPNH